MNTIEPAAYQAVYAALLTSHERRSGIGSLGSVVAHNLTIDALAALDQAGLLAVSNDALSAAWEAGRDARRDYRGDVIESNPYRG